MKIDELCRKINLQDEIATQVIKYEQQFPYVTLKDSMNKLFDRNTWDEGRKEIKQILGDDAGGIKILTCMLLCGQKTYEKYLKLGIDEQILIDTMKCFTRFIDEHKVSYGTYAFDRDWWTARQISGNLLRIGTLEYELVDEESRKVVSIHIPSDAELTKEKVKESYDRAKEILRQFFPAYQSVDMVCQSWILSPSLKEVLKEPSNILTFQKNFILEKISYEKKEFIEWVFKNPNLSLEDLPEDTSLQRNLKQFLLKGGKVGEAFGRLIEPIS